MISTELGSITSTISVRIPSLTSDTLLSFRSAQFFLCSFPCLATLWQYFSSLSILDKIFDADCFALFSARSRLLEKP